MDVPELLARYRRIMDSIHQLGNIYYDSGRMDAYGIIARIASEVREKSFAAVSIGTVQSGEV